MWKVFRWRVERDDEFTCSVVIDFVGPDEDGDWSCEMQSQPDKDGQYQSAQEFTHIVRKLDY